MRTSRFVIAALSALYATACSGDVDDAGGPGGPGSMQPGSAGAGSDPFGNSTVNPGDLPAHSARDGGGMIEEPLDECGSTSVAAQAVVVEEEVIVEQEVTVAEPVALYIMFDKSISMGQSNLWEPAVSALNAFLTDEQSAGIRVGLQYFPNGGSCSTGAGYDTPAVEVGELPAHAEVLGDSLAAQEPNGYGTPIEGALRGVTEYCKQHQAEVEDEPCVAVLVTDGKPQFASGCSENHSTLAAIAGDAHDEGVTTFAVGLQGADFDLLDAIAQQGGAPDCDPDGPRYACDVSAGADGLAATLASIRDTVVQVETRTETVTRVDEHRLPCEWELPEVPEGQSFDRDKVNIKLTADGEERTFARVSSAERCVANGWHFDDAANPSRIIACPETCETIEDLPEATIDILLGCATIVVE